MELLCDRVVIMQKGKIVQEKKIEQDFFHLNNSEAASLDFYVSDARSSIKVLKESYPNTHFELISEHLFNCSLNNEETSDAVRKLVYRDISVYRLINSSYTLEEDFFEMITKKEELSNDSVSV